MVTQRRQVGGSAPRDRAAYENEKEGKVKREDQQSLTSIFACLGILCLIFMVALVKLKHSPLSGQQRSLRQINRVDKVEMEVPQQTALPPNSLYRLAFPDGTGAEHKLSQYAGKEKFGDDGFTVLAFPTNDYGQEFLKDTEIQDFVSTNYPQVTFPVLATSQLPDNLIYKELSRQMPQNHVRHNFYKYLIGKDGLAVQFYDKKTEPLSIADDIEELIKTSGDHISLHNFVTQ